MDFLFETLAKDVMTRNVICVYPKISIKELSGIFIENVISSAPVLDKDKKIIGFVSQTDIVELDLHSEDYIDSRLEETGGYVQDIMVPDYIFAYETDSLATIVDKMCSEKNHRLIVLDEHDKIAGIITTMDVMCYLQQADKGA